jgi:CRISPR-associated protein Cas5d
MRALVSTQGNQTLARPFDGLRPPGSESPRNHPRHSRCYARKTYVLLRSSGLSGSMHSKEFGVRMHGRLACFSRPEFGTERVSYDLITPSAARGVLEAVLWKPAIRWQVRSIALLRPVRWTQFRRNEVNSRISTRNALSAATGGSPLPDFFADEDRAQRNTLALRDVDYGVVARFSLTSTAGHDDNLRKFEEMFERRLDKGQQHYQPYLGCREFPAFVEPWNGKGVLTDETRDLGRMLHDIAFGVSHGTEVANEARFFLAALRNGVVTVPSWSQTIEGTPGT